MRQTHSETGQSITERKKNWVMVEQDVFRVAYSLVRNRELKLIQMAIVM